MPEDLSNIYAQVRTLFDPYIPFYHVERDGEDGISLTSLEPVDIVIEGKVKSYPTMFFASSTIRKTSVVFYFMPVYTCPETKALVGSDLLKTLKGHTCFHLRKLTPELLAQVQQALALGHRTYVERGWVRP